MIRSPIHRYMPYQSTVNRDLCIGAASCVALAPLAFQLDSEGKAIVQETVGQVSDEQLLDAAKSCPTNAIIVTDDAGKQVWPEI